jgi:hypothetical protein
MGKFHFNEEANWPAVFKGFINRDAQADPHNKRRSTFIGTMLFVEAGLRELDDQLAGRSPNCRGGLSTLSEEDQRGASVGERAFRRRWSGKGGMSKFFMCVVRYSCADPRWRRILDAGPRQALDALPKVRAGELSLAELVETIARRDLKMWVRLARCWLFPLLLTMDSTWKSVGNTAFGELQSDYIERWVPVYEEALRQFEVQLRPDVDAERLSRMLSAQINGSASAIAGKGRGDEDDLAPFVQAAQALIYASIDPGDGQKIPAALAARVGV